MCKELTIYLVIKGMNTGFESHKCNFKRSPVVLSTFFGLAKVTEIPFQPKGNAL